MDGPADDNVGAELVATSPPQKRDEWSETGILRLLEAYEAKWLLRNRAKLKWSDWVDIAHQVSAHCSERVALLSAMSKAGNNANGKTANQCKNKIESMKKRYRAESAAVTRSGPGGLGPSWRFYARMDGLLKGPGNCNAIDLQALPKVEEEVEMEGVVERLQDDGQGILPEMLNADANGDVGNKVDENERKESRGVNSDANVSSPKRKEANEEVDIEKNCEHCRKRQGSEFMVAKSIEVLANSMFKIEQARMEMYRETEKMRAEAEIRRAELELQRTEIVANTQLQIAKLFVKRFKGSSDAGSGSPLTAALDILTKKGENG